MNLEIYSALSISKIIWGGTCKQKRKILDCKHQFYCKRVNKRKRTRLNNLLQHMFPSKRTE